jgi:hypothetical protein
MKKNLANIAFFFKRLSFVYRLIGIFGAGYLIFGVAIPDIRFNMSSGKAKEMTLAQLLKTPAEEIPRYLKIKDAVVPSGSYVEYRTGKSNSLSSIYYPVFSINEAVNNNETDIMSKLVIHDSHVTDSDLDSTGTYFSNPKFTIEGQYNGDLLDEENIRLFKESGLKVSAEAIVLNRGDTGMATSKASMLVGFGLLTMLIGVLSFIPEGTLRNWL